MNTPKATFDVLIENVNHRRSVDAPDDIRSHTVRVEVNLEQLARDMGRRACRSKEGKATVASGAIVVRRIK